MRACQILRLYRETVRVEKLWVRIIREMKRVIGESLARLINICPRRLCALGMSPTKNMFTCSKFVSKSLNLYIVLCTISPPTKE